jgi:hypothetical protein
LAILPQIPNRSVSSLPDFLHVRALRGIFSPRHPIDLNRYPVGPATD